MFRDSTSRKRATMCVAPAKDLAAAWKNDAWLVATAELLDADVVAADRRAFERLGRRYLRFR